MAWLENVIKAAGIHKETFLIDRDAPGNPLDNLFGMPPEYSVCVRLTRAEIEQLLEGKVLVFNAAEYKTMVFVE